MCSMTMSDSLSLSVTSFDLLCDTSEFLFCFSTYRYLLDSLDQTPTILDPDHFGPQPFWTPIILDPNHIEPQQFWTLIILDPDHFGPRSFWTPIILDPNHFGPQSFWTPTILDPDHFGS
ncbi:tyrosine-protein kinase receptor torso [Biomphalaria glabrata]|nr:Biomphalaria glabrata tyrosine-protein kinase receptor torso-like [Biomphalaria glabrata]